MKVMSLPRPGTDPAHPEQQPRTWKIVFDEFDSYFSALMAERRTHTATWANQDSVQGSFAVAR